MAYVKKRDNRRTLPRGGKASEKVVISTAELDLLIKKIDQLPDQIAGHIRTQSMVKAVNIVESSWVANLPEGNDEDRAKQSRKHKATWAGVPPIKNVVGQAIRKYGKYFTLGIVGPEFPHGNKAYFDYHGQTDRMMSFWAGGVDPRSGKPRAISDKNYRARQKPKRWVAQIVHDQTYKQIISILEKGIDEVVIAEMSGSVTDG